MAIHLRVLVRMRAPGRIDADWHRHSMMSGSRRLRSDGRECSSMLGIPADACWTQARGFCLGRSVSSQAIPARIVLEVDDLQILQNRRLGSLTERILFLISRTRRRPAGPTRRSLKTWSETSKEKSVLRNVVIRYGIKCSRQLLANWCVFLRQTHKVQTFFRS